MNAGSDYANTQRPLRVLQVLRAPVGGLFRHVSDLTQELARRGHDVGIICDSAPANEFWENKLAEVEKFCTLGVMRWPIQRPLNISDASSILRVAQIAKKLDVDVLHGHGAKGGAYARIAARALRGLSKRRPANFYTPHGGSLLFKAETRSGAFYHFLEKLLLGVTDTILFESAYVQNCFISFVSKSGAKFPVIHNGLSKDEFSPAGFSEFADDLVYVGELRPAKGIDVAINALAFMDPGITLSIVGSGPDEQTLRVQVKAMGLAERVTFKKPRGVREALQNGKIAVIPSLAESLPYLVLETLAMSHPAIATHVGGVPEIFGTEKEHLISPGDPRALALAITFAMQNPTEMQIRTKRLTDYVKAHFSLDHMVTRIINEYNQSLNRKSYSES